MTRQDQEARLIIRQPYLQHLRQLLDQRNCHEQTLTAHLSETVPAPQ